jgi:hypothetical protein
MKVSDPSTDSPRARVAWAAKSQIYAVLGPAASTCRGTAPSAKYCFSVTVVRRSATLEFLNLLPQRIVRSRFSRKRFPICGCASRFHPCRRQSDSATRRGLRRTDLKTELSLGLPSRYDSALRTRDSSSASRISRSSASIPRCSRPATWLQACGSFSMTDASTFEPLCDFGIGRFRADKRGGLRAGPLQWFANAFRFHLKFVRSPAKISARSLRCFAIASSRIDSTPRLGAGGWVS